MSFDLNVINKLDLNELLTYRILRSETEALNEEIIINNMYEADKIHNTHYMFAVCLSWFKINKTKTFLDLDDLFEKLHIKTLLVASPISEDTKVFMPAGTSASLTYGVQFIHGMREFKEQYLKRATKNNPNAITVKDNRAKLKNSGFVVAKTDPLANLKLVTPSVEELRKMQILQQLSWASISILVEIVDCDKIFQEELEYITREYSKEPYRYRIVINKNPIDILLMNDAGAMNVISEFGYSISNEKENIVHIRTHVKNLLRKQYNDTSKVTDEDINSLASAGLANALFKLNLSKLVNVSDKEKDNLIEYLKSNDTILHDIISRTKPIIPPQILQAQAAKAEAEAQAIQIAQAQAQAAQYLNQQTPTSTSTITSKTTINIAFRDADDPLPPPVINPYPQQQQQQQQQLDSQPSFAKPYVPVPIQVTQPAPVHIPPQPIRPNIKKSHKPVNTVTADDIKNKMAKLGKK